MSAGLHDSPNDSGFTLVEVLVSLAIFSLAIVGLNRAATLAVGTTADLDARIHAGFVADNAVVLSRMEPLSTDTQRAQAASGPHAFEVLTRTAQTELPGFFEITVSVSPEGSETPAATRRAFRYQSPVAVRSPGAGEESQP